MSSEVVTDMSQAEYQARIAELEARLEESEETLAAIRRGDFDAVVVEGPGGERLVYTLENADRPYRVLIEQIQEGALTLSHEGTVLYCNRRLAEVPALGAEPPDPGPQGEPAGVPFPGVVHAVPAAVVQLVEDEEAQVQVVVGVGVGGGEVVRRLDESGDDGVGEGSTRRGQLHAAPSTRGERTG